MTGLVVIITGYWNSGLQGSELTLTAFESGMGSIARAWIAMSIFLWINNINRMVHLLQRDPEHGPIIRRGPKDCREGFYPWNTIMGSSGHSAYSLRKRNTGAAVGNLGDFTTVFPTFVNVATLFIFKWYFL